MSLQNKTFNELITFTRATGGGRFNASGQYEWLSADQPRFDFDPVSGECRGILIEEQRTNLLLRSGDFSTTWATTAASVSANTSVAPDGTLTADTVTENTATSQHNVQQLSISFTSGTAYTLTIYAKQPPTGGQRFLQLSFGATAFTALPFANFNLVTGVVSASGSGNSASASIESVGNGWYRCRLTATADATSSSGVFALMQQNGTIGRFSSYTGDGVSGIYIWGAQLEAGAFPTSYIPTTTAQVTRAADLCSVNNLSPWYRKDEFTALVEFTRGTSFVQPGGGPLSPRIVSFGTNSEGIMQLRAFSSANLEWVGSSVSGVGMYAVAGAWGSSAASNKVGVAYKSMSTAAVSVNGGAVRLDATVPAYLGVSLMGIGRNTTDSNPAPLNGHIRRIRYIPRRISDTELQALTAL